MQLLCQLDITEIGGFRVLERALDDLLTLLG
jgi:hypothetical protein